MTWELQHSTLGTLINSLVAKGLSREAAQEQALTALYGPQPTQKATGTTEPTEAQIMAYMNAHPGISRSDAIRRLRGEWLPRESGSTPTQKGASMEEPMTADEALEALAQQRVAQSGYQLDLVHARVAVQEDHPELVAKSRAQQRVKAALPTILKRQVQADLRKQVDAELTPQVEALRQADPSLSEEQARLRIWDRDPEAYDRYCEAWRE